MGVRVLGKERMIGEAMKNVFQSYVILYVYAWKSDMTVHEIACGMREIYTSSALFVDSES